jgi:hypothetical protein
VREQFLRRQIARLAAIENCLGDVWGEIAEADNPSEIGSAHSFAHRSLQQRVRLSQEFIFVVKNVGFPRGFPGYVPGPDGFEPSVPRLR